MSIDMKKAHPFRDLTFFVSTVMAVLFSLGYLHEGIYLESFDFNSSELIPDPSTAIIFGFRYAFLNGYISIFSVAILCSMFTFFFGALKNDIHDTIENYSLLKKLSVRFNQWNNKEISSFGFYVGLVVLAGVVVFHATTDGKNLADSVKERAGTKCLIYIDKNKKGIEGNVIRIRDRFVGFWDKDKKIALMIPEKSVFLISYESCPKKGNERPHA